MGSALLLPGPWLTAHRAVFKRDCDRSCAVRREDSAWSGLCYTRAELSAPRVSLRIFHTATRDRGLRVEVRTSR